MEAFPTPAVIYCSYEREALLSVGLSITDRNTDAHSKRTKKEIVVRFMFHVWTGAAVTRADVPMMPHSFWPLLLCHTDTSDLLFFI